MDRSLLMAALPWGYELFGHGTTAPLALGLATLGAVAFWRHVSYRPLVVRHGEPLGMARASAITGFVAIALVAL